MPMKFPPHPGRSILRDCMEPLGMSVAETAQKLGVSPEQLLSVINGQAGISFVMAVGLDKLFGGGASTWYQLQAQYDKAQERNEDGVPGELEPLPSYQQRATVPLEHGRLIYTTYDDEVIAFRIVPSDNPTDSPKLSDNPNYDRVEFRFVGEGPGAVRIQLVYQPSPAVTPRLVVGVLFKAYLEWNATSEEYIGHIDAAEWNRESRKLKAGTETMNALHAGLREQPSGPALDTEKSVEPSPENYGDILREAAELLHKGTASVPASALAGV